MPVTIAMTLENYGISQFTNFAFNSMFKIRGRAYGVGNGIFHLCGDDDNGTNIDAYIKTRTVDFETQARLRNFYLGYEAEGNLTLEVTSDESETVKKTMQPRLSGQVSQSARTRLEHGQMGRYYSFKVSNQSGLDFSIDSMEATPVLQHKKPR